MIRINKNVFKDKVYACFMGKNIGGTIGGPHENKREILNVTGFETEPGIPMPNDDLDLQLVWLKAVEQQGLNNITPTVLGEYWLDYIDPYWNEYGICKANMRNGIMPPMSGELGNTYYKHSNGAWIRTEVWACMTPGILPVTCKLAYYDACVDHGHGEGTYAAIFVAALESAAFVENDINRLIEIGLSQIPEDCRVARSVKIAVDGYKNGLDWKDVRNQIVEDSADIGWFMAPGNVAFAVIGLLYGEGDFKKTMLLAVNCGDDTDCTAATVGSIMGIMYGTKGLPADWCEYIGDSIVTLSLNRTIVWGIMTTDFPSTISELSDRIINEAYRFAHLENNRRLEFCDGESDPDNKPDTYIHPKFEYETELMTVSPYSYSVRNTRCQAIVDFEKPPYIAPNGELDFKLYFMCNRDTNISRTAQIRFTSPDGYNVSGDGIVLIDVHRATVDPKKFHGEGHYRVKVGDSIVPKATLLAEITMNDSPIPLYFPIVVIGKAGD